MRKLSQKEIIKESFGDIVRGVAAAAKTAATTLAPEITRPLGRIAEPFKQIGRAYTGNQPKLFVKAELQLNYSRVFNTKTIKINKETKDPSKSNRTIVEFDAERFKPVGGTVPPTTYYAYVTRGGKDNALTMDVRDNKGNPIQGEKVKVQSKPKFDDIIRLYKQRGRITVAILSTIITRDLGINERQYASKLSPSAVDMDGAILDITNKTNATDPLSDTEIQDVKTALQSRALVENTKATQKVLIEQLKRL